MDQKQFEEKLRDAVDQIKANEGFVNSMMAPDLVSCNLEKKQVEFSFPIKDWELNIAGQLHGGIIAAMFDLSMGILTRTLTELTFVPTIEINITYIRPVVPSENQKEILVRAEVEKLGKRIVHLSADMFFGKEEKRTSMARGMFLNENTA